MNKRLRKVLHKDLLSVELKYKLKITYNSFDVSIFSVYFLHPVDVIAEVERLEPPLLSQQRNHDTSSPVQTCRHRNIVKRLEQSAAIRGHSPSPNSCSMLNSFSPTGMQ